MDKLDQLLAWVQKTNPKMTRERLMKELKESRYYSVSLVMVWENQKKY